MKKSRTGSPAGEALASPPVVTVQLPLPVLDVLADTRTAFFGLCLDAGQLVLRTLMEQERARLCGPKNVPNPERRAYRGGSVRGEVALGVDSQGRKHVLALCEGTTENATVCKALLADVRERGLDLERSVLFVIDGGTGLRKAIRETCGPTAVVQRCQVHKRRNVLEHLPESMRPRVRRGLDEAYELADAALAKRRLEQLAAGLDHTHPGAAGSLREGLEETLTLQRLGVTGALYRTVRSTNAIENLNGLLGDFVRNVRRWRNGRMLVRWIAAGLREAARGFRRLRGHHDLAALMRALDRLAMDSRKEAA